MADPDFQSEFFEPIFLKLVVLNYKIKKGEQFSEKDKMLYDIVRYAFPIITRLMGDNKMTLTDAINITTEQRSNATTTTSTASTTSTNVSTDSKTQTGTTTYYNGSKTYGFTNASSEDCDSNEIDADDDTKNVLSKLDVDTARIIESTRNREWISIGTRDMIDDDDDDEYEDSDSATEDNESDDDRQDTTIVTPVGTIHTPLASVGCRGEYNDDYDDRDDNNENIPDMDDCDPEGNYDNIVSDENFENVPLIETL